MNSRKPILLVEDDHVDAMTVRRALKEINAADNLHVAGNGEEALAFLREPQREKPGFILLDLNMPRMNGIEFLRILKQDEALKHIPVVVLTTSKEQSEKIESFRLGAAGYIIKPMNYHQFVEMMKGIHHYWTISELPG